MWCRRRAKQSFASDASGVPRLYYYVLLFHVEQCWTSLSFHATTRPSPAYQSSTLCVPGGFCWRMNIWHKARWVAGGANDAIEKAMDDDDANERARIVIASTRDTPFIIVGARCRRRLFAIVCYIYVRLVNVCCEKGCYAQSKNSKGRESIRVSFV